MNREFPFCKKNIVRLVYGACMTMNLTGAYAACTSSPSANYAGTCVVASGATFTVPSGITVSATASNASSILLNSGVTAVSISNAGTLSSSRSNGVLVSGVLSGALSNSGTITAATNGIEVTGSGARVTGGIANTGGITVTASSGGNFAAGIQVASGSIVAGGVNNTGTIASTGGGPSTGITITNSVLNGSLVNAAGGTITAQYDLDVTNGSTINGNIVNAGLLKGDLTTGIGIYISTVNGTVENTGTINSRDGIVVNNSTLTGSIVNSGTISYDSDFTNINLSAVTVGSILNTGTLFGINDVYNIYAASSHIDTIVNAGSITGGSGSAGIDIDSGSTIGSIANTSTGMVNTSNGIYVGDSTVTGNITNAGIIAGTGGSGIQVSGSTLYGLVNTGSISNANGIMLDSTAIGGDVVNQGSITGSAEGLLFDSGTTVAGSLANSGTIVGMGTAGIAIQNATLAGELSNSGSITGQTAILIGGSGGTTSVGTLNNAASGTIAGTTAGIQVNEATLGSVDNAGTISGAQYGIHVQDNAVTGPITNGASGVISSANGYGLDVTDSTVNGSIKNAGAITGGYAGVAVDASKVNGDIVNTGVIAGGTTGLALTHSTLGGRIDNSGTISGNTAIDLSNAGSVITVDNTGVLSGSVSLGNGTLNLNGSSAQVTGAVDGTDGSVVNVNGNFTTSSTFDVGTYDIASGAILVDLNDITATRGVNNAGTLVVNAAHPVTITGDYTQAATGVYAIQANSPILYSTLTVTGTATFAPNAAISVNIAQAASLALGSVLTGVVKAGTLDASTFNVSDNSILFNFQGVVDGGNVDLKVVLAQTVYQQTFANQNFAGSGAAHTFDYLIANGAAGEMGGAITALGKLSTSQQVSAAVKQTLPALDGTVAQSVTTTLNQVSRVVQARQEEAPGLLAGDSYLSDKHMWVRPFGSWAKQNADNGASGFTSNTSGIVMGADADVSPHDRIGAAFAYAHVHASADDSDAPQSAATDTYQGILYGSHSLDAVTDIHWQANGGYNSTDARRTITFTGTNQTATSSFGGWNAHAGVGLGRLFAMSSAVSFMPSARIDYTTVKNSSYEESGAGALSLNVNSQRAQELVFGADAKVSYASTDTFSVTATAGIGYDALAKNALIVSSFSGGGPAFSTEGVSPSHMLGRGGAGFTYHTKAGWEVTGRYDAEVRSKYTNQTVSLKLRKFF
ncbi:autotransporter domain-containing protein [Robbsia sp. Bb-Pol-6]|uniref:Autotransporter domain-containing protein n=1 Tax=Robbsia betulipollinis TaxID=2981849 RepID=A0ABT3ZJY4_9BURK|nr:autotransporter domain-containing protein [Robbsia betulipollinis]MCY0386821.1 autotransporter domain-containing protein [Robbsia betulipollinis]